MPMPPPAEMPPERKLLMDELIPLTGFITATGVTLDHTHQIRDKDGSWQRVRLGQRHMALKVIKRINKPTRCNEFEFRGMLDHRDAATLHDRVFTILPDEEFNGRQAWSNGRDVLSYVYGSPDNEGEQHGTWIVGDQGGVDSGFAYVKPKLPTLTPLDAHTTQGLTVSPLSKDPAVYHTSWFWLRGKDWIEASNVTLVCLDDGSSQGLQESSPWSSFYQVQFFESTDTDALTTGSLQLSVVDGGRSGTLRYHSPTSGTEPTSGGSGAANAARIVELSDIRPLCALGQPVAISLPPSGRSNAVIAAAGSISPDPSTDTRSGTDTKSSAVKETTRLVHLVTDEVSGLATFRLIFRDWQAQPLAGSGGVSDGDVDSGADSSIDYDPEVIVEYGPAGAMGGTRIEPVTEPMAAKLEQGDVESLWRADKGDYVWLWWYPASSSSSSFSSSGCPVIAEQAADELLLKVTYRHRSRRGDDNIGGDVDGMDDWAVLQRFDTDRGVQMKQTVLQRDTDLWLVRFDRDRDQESSSTTSGGKLTAHFTTTPGNVAGRGQKGFSATGHSGSSPLLCTADIHVVHASLLGSPQQTVSFLQHYLRYKDDQIKHAASVSGRETLPLHERLSSCYFYHAAVSMPKAFIYAAEVLCVLLGAKPMAMIQYTSPSELQYKFPLMPELSRGVVTATNLPNGPHDVTYAVTRYRSDETLLIYRRTFEPLMHLLLPVHQAQALHPIPYPNIDTLSAFNEEAASGGLYSPHQVDADFKKTQFRHRQSDDGGASSSRKQEQADLEWAWSRQIFYAWWNGFVLGYPEHFINSYCESFHNGLDVDEKRRWSNIAKQQVESYFNRANLTRPVIKRGSAQPISAEQLQVIMEAGVF